MIAPQSREISEFLRSVLSLVFTISLGLWNVSGELCAQDSLPIQNSDLRSDSLKLRALELDIGQAELEVTQTNVLHRCIPQIHLSGSLGLKDVLFIDPSSSLASYLPKDAYRLNITLSIGEMLDDSRHQAAELRLERIRAELTRVRLQVRNDVAEMHRELSSLVLSAELDSAGLSMKDEVLRFDELRFMHGKIEFDALIRSRLDVLHARKSLLQLERQIGEMRLKLAGQP